MDAWVICARSTDQRSLMPEFDVILFGATGFTGQLAAPESVKGNFAFRAIHEEVQRRMRVGNTLSMNTSGAEWVRGWNDKK